METFLKMCLPVDNHLNYLTWTVCLSWLSITAINTMVKSNLGEERIHCSFTSLYSLERSHGGISKQEPRSRSYHTGHRGTLLIGLLLLTWSAYLDNPGLPAQWWHDTQGSGSFHIKIYQSRKCSTGQYEGDSFLI